MSRTLSVTRFRWAHRTPPQDRRIADQRARPAPCAAFPADCLWRFTFKSSHKTVDFTPSCELAGISAVKVSPGTGGWRVGRASSRAGMVSAARGCSPWPGYSLI
jgi:hypothetical protein